jgi:lipid II:glycine glycyltransferase (peptidoglycan interpeptide bridge formation enzyme)
MCCDCTDSALVSQFADFIKGEMKKSGVCALIADPYIEEKDSRRDAVDSAFSSAGFVHNEDKDDYVIQPYATLLLPLVGENGERYTPETLLKSFDKGVRYSVRVGEQRGLVLEKYSGDEVTDETAERFFSVMNETADRVEFFTPDAGFYKSFADIFGSRAVIYLVSYDKQKDANENNARLARISEIESTFDTLRPNRVPAAKAELEKLRGACGAYEERVRESEPLGEVSYLACGLSVCFGKTSTCVFGGTKNILRNALRCSHFVNFQRVCDSIARGCDVHDMGRLPVDAKQEGHRYNGLFKFKSSFGSEYTEYIGEYTLVADKKRYFIYKKLLPAAKKLLGR